MKLKLPDDETVVLDNSLPIEDKVQQVQQILSEWEDKFHRSWETGKTKVCLDVLSNYLVFHKEEDQKKKEDKYVMSNKKVKQMKRGTRTTPFSMLPDSHKVLFGLIDSEVV